MLNALSGNTHRVITGFTLLDTETGKSISEAVETKVTFKKLTQKQIDQYIQTGSPLDKAGAYAIQEKNDEFVEKIEGSYWNVVGLPVEEVLRVLGEFG